METQAVSNESQLASLDSRLKASRESMRKLNEARLALMPRISADELKLIVDNTEGTECTEGLQKEVTELRKNRQFTEEDKDQVAAARLSHRREINSPTVKEEASALVATAGYLTAYKLTHLKNGKVGFRIAGTV